MNKNTDNLVMARFCSYCGCYHFETRNNFLKKVNTCELKLAQKIKEKKMPLADLASAVALIVNKAIPSRKEDAIMELERLEDLFGRALKDNEDTQAALIRKRMKRLRKKYPDIQ